MKNQEKVKEGFAAQTTRNQLKLMTTLVVVAGIGSMIISMTLLYFTFKLGRVETVFLPSGLHDAPVLLEKVTESKDVVKNDKFIRGFVRRFIGYYFLHPDDSEGFAKKAVGWIHAHVAENHQRLLLTTIENFEDFNEERKTKFRRFYPLSQELMKIRPSNEQPGVYFVEVPGTYNVVSEKGEAMVDSVLKLIIKHVPSVVTSLPTAGGEYNLVGLVVEKASIEWYLDPLTTETTSQDLLARQVIPDEEEKEEEKK